MRRVAKGTRLAGQPCATEWFCFHHRRTIHGGKGAKIIWYTSQDSPVSEILEVGGIRGTKENGRLLLVKAVRGKCEREQLRADVLNV